MGDESEKSGGSSIWDEAQFEKEGPPPETHDGARLALASLALVALVAALAAGGWWAWQTLPAPGDPDPAVESRDQPAPGDAEVASVSAGKGRMPDMRWLHWKSYLRQQGAERGDASDGVMELEQPWVLALASEMIRPRSWLLVGELQGERGDLPGARRAFEHALEMEPHNLHALTGLVRVLVSLGQVEAAREPARLLGQRFPSDPVAAYSRALYFNGSGEYDGAIRALTVVFNNDSGHAASLLLLGEVQLAQGNFEQALFNLSRFHRLHPSSIPGRKLLARAFMDAGQSEEAVSLLKSMVGAVSNDPGIAALLIEAYAAMGDRPEVEIGGASQDDQPPGSGSPPAAVPEEEIQAAVARLRREANRQPEPLSGRLLLAICLLRSGQAEAARELVGELMVSRPQDARVQYLSGWLAEFAGNGDTAAGFYDSARALDGNFHAAELALPPANNQRALSERDIVGLETERGNRPSALEPRLLLADAYLQQGNNVDALAVSREIVAIAPDYPLGTYLMASALLRSGDGAGGLQLMEQLETIDGDRQQRGWRLVEAREWVGDRKAARATLYEILALDDRDPRALVKLALLERSAGNSLSALELAKRLKLDHPALNMGFLVHGQLAVDAREYIAASDMLQRGLEMNAGAVTVSRWFMSAHDEERHQRALQGIINWASGTAHAGGGGRAGADRRERAEQRQRAIDLYRWVLEREPDNIAMLTLLARAYREAGDPRQVAILRDLVRQLPEQGSFRYHLALALSEHGEVGEAIEILRQLLDSGLLFDERALARALLNKLRS